MASADTVPNEEPAARDTFEIMISTDNHLGYLEKDPVRGEDSFRAFEETLRLAHERKVDFLLLGGDLFHDNKPSRRTLHRTIDLLRTHCLGPGQVKFRVVSDEAKNFDTSHYGRVNFRDPNYNVQLPVFAIHGNHDDPTREGLASYESLSALDLLSITNLVNYFGKAHTLDKITINPVLLKKGAATVALYGLGNVRDERLNRLFADGKVEFAVPRKYHDEAFNIFVLHQNRGDRGRGNKNCIHESFLNSFLDFVVWGHEHECIPTVHQSVIGEFNIVQPGSSVATSLVDGEAKQKHICQLSINENQFKTEWIPLKCVRTFVMDTLCLSTHEEQGPDGRMQRLDKDSPRVEEDVQRVLRRRVDDLLVRAKAASAEHDQDCDSWQTGQRKLMHLPLIRLKVDHRNFPVLSNQRFGQQFVGKVANPNDVLLFVKQRQQRAAGGAGASADGTGATGEADALRDPVAAEPVDVTTIDDLVGEQLDLSNKRLTLLNEPEMQEAVHAYVDKHQARAIDEFVEKALEDQQRELRRDKNRTSEDRIKTFCLAASDKARTQHRMRMEEEREMRNDRKRRAEREARRQDRLEREKKDDEDAAAELLDEPHDTGDVRMAEGAAASRSSDSASRKRKQRRRRQHYSSEDDDEEDDEPDAIEDVDGSASDSDVQVVSPPPRKRGRAASASSAAASTSSSSRSGAGKGRAKTSARAQRSTRSRVPVNYAERNDGSDASDIDDGADDSDSDARGDTQMSTVSTASHWPGRSSRRGRGRR